MDLALARFVEQELAEKVRRLDQFQLHALWQNCRIAKEQLLEEGGEGGRPSGDHPGQRDRRRRWNYQGKVEA